MRSIFPQIAFVILNLSVDVDSGRIPLRPKVNIYSTTTEATTTTYPSSSIPTTSSSDASNQPSWECGTDEFTKSISEAEIQYKCSHLRGFVNQCCYVHDACYDAQSGQKYCDDAFCSCLELATRNSPACHNESSPMFCELVRTFGDDAYLNSGPNATTTTDEGLLDSTTNDDYDYESKIRNSTI